jgi:hypothetical protein
VTCSAPSDEPSLVASAIYLILEFSQPYLGLDRIPSDSVDQVIATLWFRGAPHRLTARSASFAQPLAKLAIPLAES